MKSLPANWTFSELPEGEYVATRIDFLSTQKWSGYEDCVTEAHALDSTPRRSFQVVLCLEGNSMVPLHSSDSINHAGALYMLLSKLLKQAPALYLDTWTPTDGELIEWAKGAWYYLCNTDKSTICDTYDPFVFTVKRMPEQPTPKPEPMLPALSMQAPPADAITRQVYDPEEGAWIASPPERQQRARHLVKAFQVGTLMQAMAVRHLHDERLYVDLGFGTWKEFCTHELEASLRQANRLRAIGTRFAGLLPEYAPGEALPEDAADLSALGTRKLYALATTPEVDVSESLTKGLVTLPDGTEIPLDELKAQTAKEVTRTMRQVKKAQQDRIAALEEENALLQVEKEAYQNREEEVANRLATAETLERIHQPKALRLKAKQEKLHAAREHMRGFFQCIDTCGVTPDDPHTLMQEVDLLIQTARENAETLAAEFQDVTFAVQDRIA